jgi:hypothetical protein
VRELARRPAPAPGLEIVRTLGVAGTRFTARLHGADVVRRGGHDDQRARTHRQPWGLGGRRQPARGAVAPVARDPLVAARRAGDWLRLARVPRLLDYCTPDEADHRAFLEHHGFRLLTRTAREWELR